MSKIYLDEMRFKSYINNNLEKSISLLKEIMNIAKSLDIPYDFDYKRMVEQYFHSFIDKDNQIELDDTDNGRDI